MKLPSFTHNTLLALVFIAVIFAGVSYVVLGESQDIIDLNSKHIWVILFLNLGMLLTLIGILVPRIYSLWRGVKKTPGSKSLQKQILKTFAIVTALPTFFVAAFSILFFHLGIQAWFDARVSTTVQESLAVANAYLSEHKENVRADALAMADDLGRVSHLVLTNPTEFNRIVSAQTTLRYLTESLVFQRNRILAQGRLSFSLAFENLPLTAIERAGQGEVVLLDSDQDKVRALVRIPHLDDTFLLVGRLVDNKVIEHISSTEGAVAEYNALKSQLSGLRVTFSLVFISLSLLLLLSVVWYGLVFASRITRPLIVLAQSAERVRAGDYSARIDNITGHNEIALLAHTFNRMTEQLDGQRAQLMDANRRVDERRRFTEAVLSGVSAGIVATDSHYVITLSNRSAAHILMQGDAAILKGKPVSEVLPGIKQLLLQLGHEEESKVAQGTLTIEKDDKVLSLLVRATMEVQEDTVSGYVITFDDISPLVAAQRQAAWSDVARRIAHEIKNPLTPISLSTERIKKKYHKHIPPEEVEQFERYIETIMRHAEDIRKMVEEFVSFARMPNAMLKPQPLIPVIKKVLFSEQLAHPAIYYTLQAVDEAVVVVCDERQIAQAITNILKNAAEAIEESATDSDVAQQKGTITISVDHVGETVQCIIEDSGPGFPEDQMANITKPYVTTRAKGMGLGLAIVKKIMEEHKGTLTVTNKVDGKKNAAGARVVLSFLAQCDINTAS